MRLYLAPLLILPIIGIWIFHQPEGERSSAVPISDSGFLAQDIVRQAIEKLASRDFEGYFSLIDPDVTFRMNDRLNAVGKEKLSQIVEGIFSSQERITAFEITGFVEAGESISVFVQERHTLTLSSKEDDTSQTKSATFSTEYLVRDKSIKAVKFYAISWSGLGRNVVSFP